MPIEPAAEVLSSARVSYQKEVLSGDVAPSIVRYAEDRGCDVIVMGVHGVHASDDVGSVAREVIKLTMLPVTLIH